jgi:competence protein ComEC
VLDVGQGLAVVVRTASHAMLFDTGPRWRGSGSAGESIVLPYLRHVGVRRLDLMVLSHADADHTGGSDAIARSLPLTRVLHGAGDFGDDSSAMRCRRGDAWSWDDVRFEVLHPAGGDRWSDNDGSCVLLVTSRGGRLLLTADVQAPAEARLASAALQADVALVPHHGSSTSSSPEFVAAVRPQWALVSAGHGNRWGMPRPDVVERWRASGAIVLGTGESGALEFEMTPTDGLRAPVGFGSRHRRWWHVRTQPASGDSSAGPGKV